MGEGVYLRLIEPVCRCIVLVVHQESDGDLKSQDGICLVNFLGFDCLRETLGIWFSEVNSFDFCMASPKSVQGICFLSFGFEFCYTESMSLLERGLGFGIWFWISSFARRFHELA